MTPPFADLPPYPAIEALKARPQWVAWKYENRGGPDSKPTKPPISPRSGFKASHSDPSSWGTYEQAAALARRRSLPGVGYVLSAGDGICGIDLDHCRDAETGAIVPWATEILAMAESYAEVSPSGAGIRIFALGKPEQGQKAVAAGVEIYAERRYLTVTGNHLDGTPTEIRPAPRTLEALARRIADTALPSRHDRASGSSQPSRVNGSHPPSGTSSAEIAELLSYIPPDAPYNEWLSVLMAVHAMTGGSAEGHSLADDWSARGAKYRKGEVTRKWRSFRRDGVNGPTLAAIARGYGADLSAIRIAHMPERERESPGSAEHGAVQAARLLASRHGTLHDAGTGEVAEDVEAEQVGGATEHYDMEDKDLRPPGLVGELTDWICAWTDEPIRIHALGAALSIVGTLVARKVFSLQRPAGTHLYIGAIAPSSVGKQHPQDCIKIALNAVASGMHTGWQVSLPSIAVRLNERAAQVMIVDEFADKLAGIKNRNASVSTSAVSEGLRTIWGINQGEWTPDVSLSRGEIRIQRPALGLYGASTIKDFTSVMASKEITNGLFNRFLILPRFGEPDPATEPEGEITMPEGIAHQLRQLHECLDRLQHSMGCRGEVFPTPILVPFSPAAADMNDANKAYQKAMRRMADDDEVLSLYGRYAEMIKRIALVVACGRTPEDLRRAEIGADDMAFAERLVRYSIEQFVLMVRRDMVESWIQAQHNLVLGIVRKAKRIDRSTLYRRIKGRIKRRDLDDVIEGLLEAGNIDLIPHPAGSQGGRPKTEYRYARG